MMKGPADNAINTSDAPSAQSDMPEGLPSNLHPEYPGGYLARPDWTTVRFFLQFLERLTFSKNTKT